MEKQEKLIEAFDDNRDFEVALKRLKDCKLISQKAFDQYLLGLGT